MAETQFVRTIRSSTISSVNKDIEIVADAPGHGGASHVYELQLFEYPDAEDKEAIGERTLKKTLRIEFQNGAIQEAGVNGFTGEALLAVMIDRLKGFQSGPFSNRESAIALTHLQDAMHWLEHRTRERMERGVEGKHLK